eukprot:GEZU01023473.1.p1 GENE.GEZU01023473.1~~GEZU01023473.1.p1  ORF type:complete len:286 (-),score=110.56 GEZU01023473.1:88-945(-)
MDPGVDKKRKSEALASSPSVSTKRTREDGADSDFTSAKTVPEKLWVVGSVKKAEEGEREEQEEHEETKTLKTRTRTLRVRKETKTGAVYNLTLEVVSPKVLDQDYLLLHRKQASPESLYMFQKIATIDAGSASADGKKYTVKASYRFLQNLNPEDRDPKAPSVGFLQKAEVLYLPQLSKDLAQQQSLTKEVSEKIKAAYKRPPNFIVTGKSVNAIANFFTNERRKSAGSNGAINLSLNSSYEEEEEDYSAGEEEEEEEEEEDEYNEEGDANADDDEDEDEDGDYE